MLYTSYIDTLITVKLISISDLLFFIFSILFMISTGSYLTIKNHINFAFAKLFTLISIYVFILFIVINTNLKDSRLLNLDDSFFSSVFVYDFFSSKMVNLLLIFSIVFLVILYTYLDKRYLITSFEYPIIVLFSVFGMILILFTHDLFIWFLAIELQSFCFYALSAYRTNRSYLQTEAGLKYFLFGSLASSLYLFGISLIYVLYGTLNLDSISALAYFPMHDNLYTLYIALLLIFISFSFKLGIAPFHFWVPLVYTYSSSIVTYLFIILPKIPLFYLLFLFTSFNFSYLFYMSVFLSLAIGTIFAFNASNLKSFLAYSAIANNAFFLAPLLNHSIYSFYSFIFYLFTYNVLITILFLPTLFLKRSDYTLAFTNLRDLIILKKSNAILALLFTFAIISLAGIPPFLGFFAKFFILLSALSFASYFLVFILLGFSILSTYYYIRLLKIIYFGFYLRYASLNSFPLIPTLVITSFSLINLIFILCPTYLLVILN